MADQLSLDARTLVGIANDESCDGGAVTRFHFEQDGDRTLRR
ncbi:hypothetical protein [Haloarchaeobius iranensis]|uniref:Uncharacterized protein n=1 Tax=Haloarchaeobius iranensis TaxID=996166 RepID=A0A1G9ZR60_9EURY|nr:hypothetical protein [Haloarchaeobius iranensis]SDN23788.1 hypothetical protein SAMN05192554_12210 [Haloarchaeobius iranensis]